MKKISVLFLLLLSLIFTGCENTHQVIKEQINSITDNAKDVAESSGLLSGEKELLEKGKQALGELAADTGEGIANTIGALVSEEDKLQTLTDLAHGQLDAILNKGEEILEEIKRPPLWGNSVPSSGLEEGETLPQPPEHIETVSLEKVVDGDTIWIIDSEGKREKIRLIGIDTPESVHADETKNTEWGTLASNHTKKLLEDITLLYLEYDEEPVDQYDRTLAYVWLSEDTSSLDKMLNYIILEDGYAIAKTYKPNVKYQKIFTDLCEEAKEENAGLWSEEEFRSLWKN